MDTYREYFPTKAYRIAEMRLGVLLSKERERLDQVASSLGRPSAVGSDNLLEQMPKIIEFTREYHQAYAGYIKAILVQQPKPIQCRPACGNCCHHYPMSVEPFELLTIYSELRKGDNLLTVMEACQVRATLFEKLYEKNKAAHENVVDILGLDDKAEDDALHDYFAAWTPCPFSDAKGDCSVYPLRPVSCRMYFSETDPKYCTPQHLRTSRNDSYIVYMPDFIEEAVYLVSEHYAMLNLPESYYGGLLAVNALEGAFCGGET